MEQLCHGVCEAVREAGAFIRGELYRIASQQIEEKGWNNLVSYVDQTAERMLIARLSALLPNATYVTEENTVPAATSECYWVIDPLDGTTNFLHRLPLFSVSVGLVQDGELTLGVVYGVMQDECFYAWKGSPAYLNGTPISVSATTDFSRSLTAIGFPYSKEVVTKYMALILYLSQHTRGVRRLGSSALDLAYTACGRFDTFVEYGLSPWDMAGGVVIVRQAGGVVSDFGGGNDFLHSGQIIAANPHLYPTFQAEVNRRLQ